MSDPSKSPDRFTFQKEGYVKRQEEKMVETDYGFELKVVAKRD